MAFTPFDDFHAGLLRRKAPMQIFSGTSPEKRSRGEPDNAKIFFNDTREIFSQAWRQQLKSSAEGTRVKLKIA
jgi:hypothetical protein